MGASVFIVNENEQNILQLEKFIEDIENLKFIGSADSVTLGIEKILTLKPDIVMLEIEFEEKNGFNIAETVQMHRQNPAIIFTSNSRRHAFKSIPFRPFAYLISPFDKNKFKAAIYKIISQINTFHSNRIAINTRSYDTFINVDDILYCESIRRGVNVYFDKNTFVKINENIEKFYEYLFHKKFFRCHRGFIINLDNLISIDKVKNNAVLIKNGQEVSVDISIDNMKYLQNLFKP